MKKPNYTHTLAACCLAYVTQSVAAMFLPLLFVQFGTEFGLSIEKLTVLITITFFTQIFVDAAAPFIVKKNRVQSSLYNSRRIFFLRCGRPFVYG